MGDCVGRADINTPGTGTAAVFNGRIRFEFQGSQNDADEKPGTQTLVETHGALALPGKAGSRGKITLQDWPGIDVALLASAIFLKEGVDRNHVLQHDFVIVVSPGITGDFSLRPARILALKIV